MLSVSSNMAYTVFGFVLLTLCLSIGFSDSQDIAHPPPEVKQFRKDYKYQPSTGHFYKVHKIPLKFQDAVNTCKFESAELVVPKTAAEADLLLNIINPKVVFVWIALHDIYAEGEFVTLNGENIDTVYENWRIGEPNNVDNNEDCVIMSKSKEYIDVACTQTEAFVCSKPESEVDYQWVCETSDKGYEYNSKGDRCYKLHRDVRSWHDAFKVCRAEEAGLAIVNSPAEAKILSDMINEKYPMNSLEGNFEKFFFHLGFSDLVTPGAFHTSDGKTLDEAGYDVWEPSQPDNHNGNEHCGSLSRNGKLNDINCDVKALFICEKVLGPPHAFSLLERVGYHEA